MKIMPVSKGLSFGIKPACPDDDAGKRYPELKREIDSDLDALTSLQALYYHFRKSNDIERSEFRHKQVLENAGLESRMEVLTSGYTAFEQGL